jgi:CheY-like chemotaxis protein
MGPFWHLMRTAQLETATRDLESFTYGIPVIVLTSSNEENGEGDALKIYDLGLNSYVQKPADFDQFRGTIHALGLHWLLVAQDARPQSLDNFREKSG